MQTPKEIGKKQNNQTNKVMISKYCKNQKINKTLKNKNVKEYLEIQSNETASKAGLCNSPKEMIALHLTANS